MSNNARFFVRRFQGGRFSNRELLDAAAVGVEMTDHGMLELSVSDPANGVHVFGNSMLQITPQASNHMTVHVGPSGFSHIDEEAGVVNLKRARLELARLRSMLNRATGSTFARAADREAFIAAAVDAVNRAEEALSLDE